MATGLRESRAFCTAVAASVVGSSSSKLLPSLHAQPEPVPSGERTVLVMVTLLLES